jgi:hypothetical protein
MAFTFAAEDGTGLTTANSFGTVAEADDYHDGRGNTAWASIATSALKEDCLVRATDYIEKRFGHKFRGFRRSGDQALSWPRLDAWDNSGYAFADVPTKLKQASFEYALRSASLHELTPDPLSPVQPQTNLTGETRATGPTGSVTKVKESVGPIEEETEYDKGGSLSAAGVAPKSSLISDYNIPEYPAADMLLHGMLLNSSSRTVVRG